MTTIPSSDGVSAPAKSAAVPAGIRLPPSARKIFAVFSDGNAHTIQELKKKTGFSIRCTRYAVQLLKQNKLVIARFNFHDARQPLYQRAVPDQGTEAIGLNACRTARPSS